MVRSVIHLTCFAILIVAGCGGGGEQSDTATVTLPEPTPGTAAPPAPSGDSSAQKAMPPAAVKGFGTLRGRVLFTGEVPAPKVLVKKGDKAVKDADSSGQPCCSAQDILAQDIVVDPATKGVRYALVFLPHPTTVKPEAESAAKAAPLVLTQKGCTFEPHVLAGIKGATLSVSSNDPISHNVDSMLPGNRFNTMINPGQPPFTFVLASAEAQPGMIVCDIHTWMKAWLFVADNPYFAVTNDRGEYVIPDVPAGKQEVVVWQESVAATSFVTPPGGETVSIAADGETTKNFVIDRAQLAPVVRGGQ